MEKGTDFKWVGIEGRMFTEALLTRCLIALCLNNKVKKYFMNKNLSLLTVTKH